MAGPLPAEEALEGQQLAAAADEAGGRRVLQLAEAGLQGGAQVGTGAGRGWRGKQPRVGLLLVEHRDEPVGEMQCAGAEDPAAEVVVLEVALAGEHGVADAPAGGQRPVEGEHEAPGGLDQDAVAHGHDRGDADLEQLRGDRFRRLLGLRALAGFEEDQRDAVRLQQRAERVGMDGQMLAPLQLYSPDTFAWAAGEAVAMREVRRALLDKPELSPDTVKVTGYWRRDESDFDYEAPLATE